MRRAGFETIIAWKIAQAPTRWGRFKRRLLFSPLALALGRAGERVAKVAGWLDRRQSDLVLPALFGEEQMPSDAAPRSERP